MRKSKKARSVVAAHKKGYRVLDDGALVSPKGKILKGYDNSGYRYFTFCEGKGKTVSIAVHQLMAFQKYGELALADGVHVRHLKKGIHDNSRSNISIGTQSENMMDIDPEKRRTKAIHAASFLRSLSPSDAQQLIDDRAAGASYKTLMKKYGVAKGTVSYIVNGKTYPELKRPQK